MPDIESKIPPVTEQTTNFVDLTNAGFVVGKDPHADSIRFWDNFFHKWDIFLRFNSIPVY